MKVLHLIFTGLGTTPLAEGTDPRIDCGMLLTAKTAATQNNVGNQHLIAAFAWDGSGSPDANCRAILTKVRETSPDKVIVYAHSFGNSLLDFLIEWLARWHVVDGFNIDLAFCFDPCHNYGTFGHLDWNIATGPMNAPVVKNSWSFYNTDPFRCWGVVGTPFKKCPNVINVTDWTGPTLAHVNINGFTGIPASDRIREQYVYPAVTSLLT